MATESGGSDTPPPLKATRSSDASVMCSASTGTRQSATPMLKTRVNGPRVNESQP